MRRLLLAALASTALCVAAHAQAINGEPSQGGYPSGAIPVTNSAQGTTGAAVVTLPAATSRWTFLSGFEVTEVNPTAAVNITVTVANTIGGSMVYTIPTLAAAATTPNPPPLVVEFNQPIPATAPNVTITVTASAAGAGGVVNVVAHGYQHLVQ